jgi:alkylation response protein AidB-like acyl-CoA dehydrogenase
MTATSVGFDEEIGEELVARARALAPLIREHAPAAEHEARMPDAVMQAMKSNGLLDIIVPKSQGGAGASWTTYQRVTYELARISPAAGWLHGIVGASSFYLGRFPQHVKDEVFVDGRAPTMSGVISLGGIIEPVEGGYLATAKWPFSTGCYHAEWALGAVAVKNPDGTLSPGATIVVPASDFKIEDSWKDVTGMRGTGSATVVIDGAFVPQSRVVPPEYRIDRTLDDLPEDAEMTERWPIWALLVGTNTAVALGAAEAMLDKVCKDAGRRGITYTNYQRISDSQVAQAEVAKAAMKIRAAGLVMYESAAELDRVAVTRQRFTSGDRSRSRGEHAFAVDLLRQAADALLTVYGTSAFTGSNDLQLHWRDINVITRHAIAATNTGMESYGKVLLGAEPNNIMLPYL